jgi:hypothetical protein
VHGTGSDTSDEEWGRTIIGNLDLGEKILAQLSSKRCRISLKRSERSWVLLGNSCTDFSISFKYSSMNSQTFRLMGKKEGAIEKE